MAPLFSEPIWQIYELEGRKFDVCPEKVVLQRHQTKITHEIWSLVASNLADSFFLPNVWSSFRASFWFCRQC